MTSTTRTTTSSSTTTCSSLDNDENDNDDAIFDVVIIGGGVVGLSILHQAVTSSCGRGWRRCALVEQEEQLLTWASGSNSGILCTGVDIVDGSGGSSASSLERALIRDSISRMRPFLTSMNIPHRSCGSLVCEFASSNEDDDKLDKDEPFAHDEGRDEQDHTSSNGSSRLDDVLAQSHDAGDRDATLLTRPELLQREPNLNPHCVAVSSNISRAAAVHVPGEIIVDPWLFAIALAVQARAQGATILTNFTMDPTRTTWNAVTKTWTVVRRRHDITSASLSTCSDSDSDGRNEPPLQLRARAVINATGAWADQVQEQVHRQQLQQELQQMQQRNGRHDDDGDFVVLPSPCDDTVLPSPQWTSQPRRGQYRVFASTPRTSIQHPIQPIPTLQTKGIFVFPSLYHQIIVGPTALDQESQTNRHVDAHVAETLTRHVQRLLPALNVQRDYIGDFVGIRPGTEHRDYQIHLASASMPWISVAGIRSTGLTASLGIGRHVTQLLAQVLPSFCQPKELIPNNNASSTITCNGRMDHSMNTMATTPLPPLQEMIECYHRRGDGMVEIYGHLYKVTHPITIFGWKSLAAHLTAKSQPRYKSKL